MIFPKITIGRRSILTSTMIMLGISLSGPALADEVFSGMITKIYRANGKIGIQLLDDGIVGVRGAIVDLDVLDGLPFDRVEPGDRLDFSVEQIGGVWTITRFQGRE